MLIECKCGLFKQLPDLGAPCWGCSRGDTRSELQALDPQAGVEQGEMGHFNRLDTVLGEGRADNSIFPKWNNNEKAETSTLKLRQARFFRPLQSGRLMQLLLPTLSSAICVPLRQTELLNIKSGDLEQTERPSKPSAGLSSLQSTVQE